MRERDLPDGLAEEVDEHVRRLEERTGKRFGSDDDPLLVSVRSGAAVSMPGMMDTILNLGLNDEAAEGLAARTGNPRFAYDSYRRLIQMFGEVVEGIDGHRFESALGDAQAGPRRRAGHRPRRRTTSRARRDVQGHLPRGDGHATSRPARATSCCARCAPSSSRGTTRARRCTAARTRSPTTSAPPSTSCRWSSATRATAPAPASRSRATRRPARPGCTASSSRTRRARTSSRASGRRSRSRRCASSLPEAFEQLLDTMRRLEEHYRDMQDIEFTVEDEQLYLLQTRSAKRTAAAALKAAVDDGRRGADRARGGRRRGSTPRSSTSCCTR